MSLDLQNISKSPILKDGTGVYVREKGELRELESLTEARKYFPDADISHIKEFGYETDDMWHGNITLNMTKRVDHVPIGKMTLYVYLWKPKENGFYNASAKYPHGVFEGLMYLINHKEQLLSSELTSFSKAPELLNESIYIVREQLELYN